MDIYRTPLLELTTQLKDDTVFIVGGGQSLRGFDYNILQDRKVIGINQACVYIPNLTAIYWADEDWAAKNDDTLERHSCKLRFCAKRNPALDYATNNTYRMLGGAIPLKLTGDQGFDPDINNVRGNNSGCHVLNLCVNAGAKRIVLLGFDMQVGHWHNAYELSYNTEVYQGFLQSINSMAAELPSDVEVINCSMISAIEAFPKVPIDVILQD